MTAGFIRPAQGQVALCCSNKAGGHRPPLQLVPKLDHYATFYGVARSASHSYNAPSHMGSPRILHISIRNRDQAIVVDLEGAIDLQNSHGLRTTLFEQLSATSRLALNMTGIRYIDSSGIATLIEVLKKARELKKDFVLFGLGTTVHDVLKLTGLLGVFRIADSEEHALTAGS